MNFDLEKFDKYIWRINGAIVFAIGIVAILAAIGVGISSLSSNSNNGHKGDLTLSDSKTASEDKLSLGQFEQLKGTDFLLAPLTSSESGLYDSLQYKGAGNSKNYLIFNFKSLESYWVYRKSTYLVKKLGVVYNKVSEPTSQKAIGLIFEVIDKDTNFDNKVNSKDSSSIQFFELGTKKYVWIVGDIDRTIEVHQHDESQVLMVYAKDGKSYFKTLNVGSLEVSDEMELPQPN